MKSISQCKIPFFAITLFLSATLISGQQKGKDEFLGKADLYKAKKSALEYLSDSLIVRKYGAISDSIWHYAELGMQEFKSSAILIKTLDKEGFNIEKGVAGMPTCFIAELASGTTLDTVTVITAVHQKHSNKGMVETIRRNIELIGLPEWTEREHSFAKSLQKEPGAKETGYPLEISPWHPPSGVQVGGGSTDVGEVILIVPTATLNFPGGVPGAIIHHWSSVASFYGSAAWKGLNAGAKVMAATTLDLLTKPKLLNDIKNEFAEYSKGHPYKSFLPEGAKPPVDLNRELMDKYSNAMMQTVPED